MTLTDVFELFTKKSSMPSDNRIISHAITSKLSNRGPSSSGVYYLEFTDCADDDDFVIKHAVPKDGAAPYLERAFERNEKSNPRSNLSVVSTSLRDAAGYLVYQKYGGLGQKWVDDVVALVLSSSGSYVGTQKPAKRPPKRTVEAVNNNENDDALRDGKRAKVPIGPRVLCLSPEKSPHVEALDKAADLVLADPEATRHFISPGPVDQPGVHARPRRQVHRQFGSIHLDTTFQVCAAAGPRGTDLGIPAALA